MADEALAKSALREFFSAASLRELPTFRVDSTQLSRGNLHIPSPLYATMSSAPLPWSFDADYLQACNCDYGHSKFWPRRSPPFRRRVSSRLNFFWPAAIALPGSVKASRSISNRSKIRLAESRSLCASNTPRDLFLKAPRWFRRVIYGSQPVRLISGTLTKQGL